MKIPEVNIKNLLEAGVHLGHKTLRWNPKMKQYIFGEKNSIHIIDLTQTVTFLKSALNEIHKCVLNGGKILCDVGANPEVKPENLLQFAVMSSVYLEHVEGINNPKIGLINIGAEPSKGTELYKETHKLLSSELTNFIGNIEARNIFDCKANVLVCDGFVGNTIMKFAEGSFAAFLEMIKEKIMTKNRYKVGARMIKPALEEIRNQYDFEEHGGTPFLGVNGIAISCHGASTAKAIMNSIFLTEKSIKENLINDISNGIDQHLGAIN